MDRGEGEGLGGARLERHTAVLDQAGWQGGREDQVGRFGAAGAERRGTSDPHTMSHPPFRSASQGAHAPISRKPAAVLQHASARSSALCFPLVSPSLMVSLPSRSRLALRSLSWIPIVSALRQFIDALRARGQPKPVSIRQRADGQYVVKVTPKGLDTLLLGGVDGEVWIMPGEKPTQGALYRGERPENSGAVSLVLGAGNQISVVALDILHKLLFDDEVVICKMNPVNEYLGPYLAEAFAPLIDAGFLRIVYGGGDVGAFLTNHDTVASVHLTGSARTFNSIVWHGEPKPGEEPPFRKPVGAELGCVTPYIIVPGKWSRKDLEYHAESVVAGKTHNAGHNCIAAELLVVDEAWPQRQEFLDILREKFNSLSRRVAYYPGSEAKIAAFAEEFDGDVEKLGITPGGEKGAKITKPWMFKANLSPESCNSQDENWCGALQEVVLPSKTSDAADFLKRAVDFANNKAWGTLSCCVFAHPRTRAKLGPVFDQAIADLRYGSIIVNAPGIVGFALTGLTWGGFPGHTIDDIGSGNCVVHNTFMIDHPQKSVLYVPWHFHPKPFWSPFNSNVEPFAVRFGNYLAHPSIFTLLGVLPAALQG